MNNAIKKESIIHGTMPYHFAVYRHDSKNYGLGFSPHWHEEYEIIYVKKGTFSFLINGKKHSVKKDQALLIDRYALHVPVGYEYEKYGNYVCYVFGQNFLFPDSSSYICKQFYSTINMEQFTISQLITGELPVQHSILRQIEILDRLSAQPEVNALSIQICLLTIFDILLKERACFPVENRPVPQNEIVRAALIYIHENYRGGISVKSLASSLHLSTNHFIKIFHTLVGLTPQKYVQKLRIQDAVSLLTSNTQKSDPLSISEIASMVGYNDTSYFSRVFRKETGQSPSSLQLHRAPDS